MKMDRMNNLTDQGQVKTIKKINRQVKKKVTAKGRMSPSSEKVYLVQNPNTARKLQTSCVHQQLDPAKPKKTKKHEL